MVKMKKVMVVKDEKSDGKGWKSDVKRRKKWW